MNCPACQTGLAPGEERCPGCGAIVAPAVLGALAPDPSRATPPARGKAAPIREIPALRKREKSEKNWKEEVRERVQKRKRKPKGDASPELPIFGEPEPVREPERLRATESRDEALAEPPPSYEPEPPAAASATEPDLDLRPPPLAEAEAPPLEDEPELPFRPAGPMKLDIPEPEAYDPLSETPEAPAEPEAEQPDAEGWRLEDAPAASELRSVERPAQFAERFEAGAVDAALLGSLAAIVVYFASRAAHVPVLGLLPAWPWLSGYLALLGLAYAAYFTGTTGQTPGKMLVGLRVVEASGGPPSYPRALVRAAAGALGSLLAGAFVLPLFFDPARRALHDRLFRTRVVKY